LKNIVYGKVIKNKSMVWSLDRTIVFIKT